MLIGQLGTYVNYADQSMNWHQILFHLGWFAPCISVGSVALFGPGLGVSPILFFFGLRMILCLMELEASPFSFLGFVVMLLVLGLCWFVCNCLVSYCWFVVFFSLVGATSWFGFGCWRWFWLWELLC